MPNGHRSRRRGRLDNANDIRRYPRREPYPCLRVLGRAGRTILTEKSVPIRDRASHPFARIVGEAGAGRSFR